MRVDPVGGDVQVGRLSDLSKVADGFGEGSPHKELALELVDIINLIKSGKVNYYEARMRMNACKYIIQLMVLERMRKTEF